MTKSFMSANCKFISTLSSNFGKTFSLKVLGPEDFSELQSHKAKEFSKNLWFPLDSERVGNHFDGHKLWLITVARNALLVAIGTRRA